MNKITFSLVGLLILLLPSCTKEDLDTNLIGKWNGEEYIDRFGVQYTNDFKLVIKNDGTAKFTYLHNDREYDYVWLLRENNSLVYLIKENVSDGSIYDTELPTFEFEVLKNTRDEQVWREEYLAWTRDHPDSASYQTPFISEWTLIRK